MAVDDFPASHGSLASLSDSDHHTQYVYATAGAFASRPVPTATRVNQMYFATDTDVVYISDGAAWTSLAGVTVPLILTSTAPAMLPLTVKGAVSQTETIFAVKDSGDATLVEVEPDGHLSAYYGCTVWPYSASTIGLTFRSNSGQTGSLTEWRDTGSVAQTVVTSYGAMERTDVRNTTMGYTSGNLTSVIEKVGATTVKTTTLTYTGSNLTSTVEVFDGKTITTTLTYDGANVLTGTTRVRT